MPPPSDYLTDAEAGALIRKSAATVRRWRRGEGLAFLPGRPALIERSEFLTFVALRKLRIWSREVTDRDVLAVIPNPTPADLAHVLRHARRAAQAPLPRRPRIRH